MKSNLVDVILMAGGKGTRLRPFTNVLPKPLVPLGETSIMEMVLQQLSYFGFKRITISIGYKAEIIMAVIGDGKRFGLEVNYHLETKPLGTLGAVAGMENLADNVLIMNGDICTNLNFMDFLKKHCESGSAATIGSYVKKEQLALGILEVDESQQKVTGFKEKPMVEHLVSMGVNAFNKSALELIPRDHYFGFDDMMYKMLTEKTDIRYSVFDGLWYDVGRPDDYERMLESFSQHSEYYLPSK